MVMRTRDEFEVWILEEYEVGSENVTGRVKVKLLLMEKLPLQPHFDELLPSAP